MKGPLRLLPHSQCTGCTSVLCMAPCQRLGGPTVLLQFWFLPGGDVNGPHQVPTGHWSVLGRSCVFQQGSHVQQGVFHGAGELCGVGLLTAVEGCDGNVDVLVHWVVAHSVAVWHYRAEAHHAIGLGADLKRIQIGQKITSQKHSQSRLKQTYG